MHMAGTLCQQNLMRKMVYWEYGSNDLHCLCFSSQNKLNAIPVPISLGKSNSENLRWYQNNTTVCFHKKHLLKAAIK